MGSDVVVVGSRQEWDKWGNVFGWPAPSKMLAAVWLRPVPSLLALLEEVVDCMVKSSLLGLGSLAEESVTFHMVLKRGANAGVNVSFHAGTVASYEQFTGSSQVRAMRAAGHWHCAHAEFADVAGTWDIFYHNGFRTSYEVSEKGEVRATRADGPGISVLQAVEAGRFSHKLLGIHRPGTWERFRLDGPGRLHLEHWQQETLLSIAKGFRKEQPPLPGCGCPEDEDWCVKTLGILQAWCGSETWEASSTASAQKSLASNLKDARIRHLLRTSPRSPWQVRKVSIGIGGGFGSKLQMAVASAVKAMHFGKRSEFFEHMGRYTNNSKCLAFLGEVQFRQGGWACLFKEMPRSSRRLSRTAARQSRIRMLSAGSVQAALWQPSSLILEFFERFQRGCNCSKGQGQAQFRIAISGLGPAATGRQVTNPFNRYHAVEDYVYEVLRAAEELQLCRAELCQLFVASDSADIVDEVISAMQAKQGVMQVIGLRHSETHRRSAVGVEVARFLPGDATALQMAAEEAATALPACLTTGPIQR
ncbi:PDE9A [Symbiodinium necroappetens]|uniref:PDE9A protein n=1 Tax=Symbiodinium necroappetens TaxID=1628268 RepID=A0A812TC27_9DINO|nr:PDE9A [Symbiodinium necroappetens]